MSFESIRIVTVDYYMTQPSIFDCKYSQFRGSSISQVPVIRIFGSTSAGAKICLHVHKVFPYFYLPFDATEDPTSLQYQIATNIDKALNISYGKASSTTQYVYKVSLISGIPFYGYHTKEHQFFKVELYNPNTIKRLSNLLQSDAILGKFYQPHEVHIPYILQFMIDYNLHGMSKINLSDLSLRNEPEKVSLCALEADTISENILNRLEINEKLTINPGISALWEDEKQRLRLKGEKSQLDSCLTMKDDINVPCTDSHLVFKQALIERLIICEGDEGEELSLNQSVYSAEVSSSTNLHQPNLDCSLNSSISLNTTLNEDGKDLFQILKDLAFDNRQDNMEEDNILSQILPQDDDFDDLDLSICLNDLSTKESKLNDSDEDLFDTTIVPQVDGQFDDSSDDNEEVVLSKFSEKKVKSVSKYSSLPIVLSSSKIQTQCKKTNVEHVKKQLPFTDHTIIEEYVSCKFLQNQTTTANRENLLPTLKSDKTSIDINVNSRLTTTSSEQKEELLIFEHSPNKNAIIEDYFNVFPEKDNSFSVADLYDQKTNYKAKEGCSTIFTQDTIDSQNESFSSTSIKSSQVNEETLQNDLVLIQPKLRPPSADEVLNNLQNFNISSKIYPPPFYSNPHDVTGSVEVGSRVLKIGNLASDNLDEYQSCCDGLKHYRKSFFVEANLKYNSENLKKMRLLYTNTDTVLVIPSKVSPTPNEALNWLKQQKKQQTVERKAEKVSKIQIIVANSQGESDSEITLSDLDISQSSELQMNETITNSCEISGMQNQSVNKTIENFKNAKPIQECQNLTLLSVELHVCTRGDLRPDPKYDQINAIFYSTISDVATSQQQTGALILGPVSIMIGVGIDTTNCQFFDTEPNLFEGFIDVFRKIDPDIFFGYEIELFSFGYLIERATLFGINLLSKLSRIRDSNQTIEDSESLTVTGRIVLDIWRLMRHEIAAQSYKFENVCYKILNRRFPLYTFCDLTVWWRSSAKLRHRVFDYYISKVKTTIMLLEQLDLIGRTSELARLFGIQFYEVLSRGSQFRVESMMLRSAKPLNFIPVSPSVQQRAKMKAPEFLPLILEPESRYYQDPVIVLDFQSLYPSIMIAYNYCFSTCLGKVSRLGGKQPFEFGATELKISRKRVQFLLDNDNLNFSPAGVTFVKRKVRDGILPRMLRQILDTRLMVKKSLKANRDDKTLKKVLHSRQLGLKLIANVTYGYTSANFSGRMPAVELADSVVSKGRETLQRAIRLVEDRKEWGARVVYGDTDSLFVLVEGRTRPEAFRIGEAIAAAVTDANPDPIKLKLEKVYHPCILQTKKRYVGYMYEGVEQIEPVFEAKGIETVRRDGCPAVGKMLERCLRLLFETNNISLIKKYVLRQFDKIVIGRVSLQDLTFAKEYRGASGYKPGSCVPALELTRKWTSIDRRNEPRAGERVPYVIANGPPGLPLIKLVRSPLEFLQEPSLRPNSYYYITKVIIPPINRCFSLIGADLNQWFAKMPRKYHQYMPMSASPGRNKLTISQYFQTMHCTACGRVTANQERICKDCQTKSQNSAVTIHAKIRKWEKSLFQTKLICQSCTGFMDSNCISLDCPVLYKLSQFNRDYQQVNHAYDVLNLL